jgi:hypothetical protein
MKSLSTLIPMRLLFQKFTFKPEALSNPIRIAFKDQRFSTRDGKNIHTRGYQLWIKSVMDAKWIA